VTIFLYAGYVMAAGAVLCASYAIAAGAVLYAGRAVAAGAGARGRRRVWVKGFADACYRNREVIVYCKDKEGVQKRKKVIASLVRVELRRS
jgi:hypothetical protein